MFDFAFNNYTSDWTAKIGDKEWGISQFNNANWTGWTFIKAGRKENKTSDVTTTPHIKTKSAFTEAINCVAISYGSCGVLDYVSNAKLIVASDAAFTQDIKEYDLTITTATEVKCNITTPAANRYYKISYNCGPGKGNGYLVINEVTYFY